MRCAGMQDIVLWEGSRGFEGTELTWDRGFGMHVGEVGMEGGRYLFGRFPSAWRGGGNQSAA